LHQSERIATAKSEGFIGHIWFDFREVAMGRSQCFVSFALAAILALACNGWTQENQTRPNTQRVEDRTRQALQDARSYRFDRKMDCQLKLQYVVDQLNRQIDLLERKSQAAGAKAREEYRRQLPELRRLRDRAAVELRKVQEATPGAWEEIKQGAGNAVEDLRKAVDRAARNFR
jgi:hypothetical protein